MLINSLFKLLYLIKSSYQILFEIIFNIRWHNFNRVIFIINFALIKFILDEFLKFLIEILTIKEILRAFTFRERSMDSMHILVHFRGDRLCIFIIFKTAFLRSFVVSIGVWCWLVIIYLVIIILILIVDVLHNGW